MQRVGDAELHDAYVRGDLRDDVALALLAEIADVHVHHARKHFVAHPLERPGAHGLDRPRAQVAEQIAQEADDDGHDGQQQQHVARIVGIEQMRIGVVEQHVQVVAVEAQGRQLFDVLGREPVVEHRVQDRNDETECQGVEQGVEQREDSVGNGVSFDRPGESQQPHVGFEHSERRICGCAIIGAKIGK